MNLSDLASIVSAAALVWLALEVRLLRCGSVHPGFPQLVGSDWGEDGREVKSYGRADYGQIE